MKIAAAGLALCVSLTMCPASFAEGELPPGGPSWVRVKIDGTGKPRGYVEYEKYCSACHGEGPEDRPGYTALKVRYNGALPAALPDRTDLVPEYIKYLVRNGVSIMPRARRTEISDAELDAIVAYLTRNNPNRTDSE
jgi:mono/diheme cytochrome c family protein